MFPLCLSYGPIWAVLPPSLLLYMLLGLLAHLSFFGISGQRGIVKSFKMFRLVLCIFGGRSHILFKELLNSNVCLMRVQNWFILLYAIASIFIFRMGLQFNGIGGLVRCSSSEVKFFFLVHKGDYINNHMEAHAILFILEQCCLRGQHKIIYESDSQEVVDLLDGIKWLITRLLFNWDLLLVTNESTLLIGLLVTQRWIVRSSLRFWSLWSVPLCQDQIFWLQEVPYLVNIMSLLGIER